MNKRKQTTSLTQIIQAIQTLFSKNTSTQKKIGAVIVIVGAIIASFFSQTPPPSQAPLADQFAATILKISDGDTLTVVDEHSTQHRVRLAFIDAPESQQNEGSNAQQFLKKLIHNQTIKVEVMERDRYGRVVGKIWLNGRDINFEMVKHGFAWHYTQYAKKQSKQEFNQYSTAQNTAKQQQIGLWRARNPQAPWDYRKEKRAN